MLEASVAYVLMSYNQGIRPIHSKIKTKTSPQLNPQVNPHPKPQTHAKPKSPSAVELYFMRK
jgi:hypothetical protein